MARSYSASGHRERGLLLVRRVYVPRIIGLALGAFAIGPVLWTNGAHPAVWFGLFLGAFVWPHVSYGLGLASRDPYAAELRNMMVDSVLGGIFIALMKFNVLPSVLLLVMLSMDKLAVGGLRFLVRCTFALVAACVLTAIYTGLQVRFETAIIEVYGSLPLLVAYPVAVGLAAYQMARRMQYQARQLEAISRTDGISQMLTRQAWEEDVAEEFAASQRSKSSASILLVDIDNLEGINNHHGYPTGDEVIRSVSGIVRAGAGDGAVSGRYGGGRFAVLLPGSDQFKAEQSAERIRNTTTSDMLARSVRIWGSVSIGIAEADPFSDQGHRSWIARAEEALSIAKKNGGNRTARFRLPEPAAPGRSPSGSVAERPPRAAPGT